MTKHETILVGRLANYRVTETVSDEGDVSIKFTMTNPPRGFGHELYAWNGRKSSLTTVKK